MGVGLLFKSFQSLLNFFHVHAWPKIIEQIISMFVLLLQLQLHAFEVQIIRQENKQLLSTS